MGIAMPCQSVRISAPAIQPVTLAEVKLFLKVVAADEDSIIQSLLDAAVDQIDAKGQLGFAMINQTWQQWMPAGGDASIIMGPISSLVAVRYYDSAGALQDATLSDFEIVGTGLDAIVRVKSGKSWPIAETRPDAVAIEYIAGLGASTSDIPGGLRTAIFLLVSHWFENRGIMHDQGAVLPRSVDALIERHRVNWYG